MLKVILQRLAALFAPKEVPQLGRNEPACRSLPRSGADGLRRDLAGLGGTLRLDDASRQDAAEDFGHIVHRRPLAVLRPSSADDVVAVVRYANRHGLP